MVKKYETHYVSYRCEECEMSYETEQEAKECEARIPEPVEWLVGDFVLAEGDDEYTGLARISDEEVKDHFTQPILEFIDDKPVPKRPFHSTGYHITVVTDKIRKRILRWAKALEE